MQHKVNFCMPQHYRRMYASAFEIFGFKEKKKKQRLKYNSGILDPKPYYALWTTHSAK